jgi:hypothetical protein
MQQAGAPGCVGAARAGSALRAPQQPPSASGLQCQQPSSQLAPMPRAAAGWSPPASATMPSTSRHLAGCLLSPHTAAHATAATSRAGSPSPPPAPTGRVQVAGHALADAVEELELQPALEALVRQLVARARPPAGQLAQVGVHVLDVPAQLAHHLRGRGGGRPAGGGGAALAIRSSATCRSEGTSCTTRAGRQEASGRGRCSTEGAPADSDLSCLPHTRTIGSSNIVSMGSRFPGPPASPPRTCCTS